MLQRETWSLKDLPDSSRALYGKNQQSLEGSFCIAFSCFPVIGVSVISKLGDCFLYWPNCLLYLFSIQTGNATAEYTVDNSAIEEKLSEIAEHLKEIKAKDNNYSADDTNNLLESNKTNKLLAMGIAALLAISIVVQVVMVTKISALQEAQSTVTKVSMIGDMTKR